MPFQPRLCVADLLPTTPGERSEAGRTAPSLHPRRWWGRHFDCSPGLAFPHLASGDPSATFNSSMRPLKYANDASFPTSRASSSMARPISTSPSSSMSLSMRCLALLTWGYNPGSISPRLAWGRIVSSYFKPLALVQLSCTSCLRPRSHWLWRA